MMNKHFQILMHDQVFGHDVSSKSHQKTCIYNRIAVLIKIHSELWIITNYHNIKFNILQPIYKNGGISNFSACYITSNDI